MPFSATWIDLESVITYWIKYVREGEISYDIPYMCNLKNEINELTYKQKETHRLRQRTYGFWGEGWEEEIVREFGIDMYILLYLKQITNKDLFCTAHGMLCDSLDGRGVWGRMDTNICMAGSLHCSPETITTLLVIWLYPNTKFKVLKTNKKSWLEKGNQMPSRFYALFYDCCYAHFCKNIPNKPIKSSYILVIKLKKKKMSP